MSTRSLGILTATLWTAAICFFLVVYFRAPDDPQQPQLVDYGRMAKCVNEHLELRGYGTLRELSHILSFCEEFDQ